MQPIFAWARQGSLQPHEGDDAESPHDVSPRLLKVLSQKVAKDVFHFSPSVAVNASWACNVRPVITLAKPLQRFHRWHRCDQTGSRWKTAATLTHKLVWYC